jgi:hypothetical protein
LLKSRRPELVAVQAETNADRDMAYADSEKALNRNGVSVETVSHGAGAPIALTNGDAAAIVFAHRVRESAGYRDANERAEAAKAAAEGCAGDIRSAELAVTKAKTQLASVIAQIVGMPTASAVKLATVNAA